jgi:hypothetical protein
VIAVNAHTDIRSDISAHAQIRCIHALKSECNQEQATDETAKHYKTFSSGISRRYFQTGFPGTYKLLL